MTGTAEDGSTVKLYADASCTGAVAGQGAAAQFAGAGIAVHVADGTSTTFFATATDAAGNTSACSSSFLRYVEDTSTTMSGVISSVQTGRPIPGATVTLFRSDTATGSFVQVPQGDPIMSSPNRANPGTTDASGHYGWGVISGFYRLHVSATGCSPQDSQVIEMPGAVGGLDLALDCPIASVGGGGAGASQAPAKRKCRKAKKHKKRAASTAKAHCKKKRKKKTGR
jgi:hypothetical protein